MEQRELISVIIPVYNLETEITRCVKSIQKQTYNNLEIILIDDGSSDNSWNVIQQISKNDSRIVIIHQENQGVTKARLTGVNYSNGKYIGFVDGDDEIEEDMYEILLSNAQKYNADISQCGIQMIFSDDRISYFHNSGDLIVFNTTDAVKELLSGKKIEPGLCNKLFKKESWDRMIREKNIDESIKINEDLLLNYYLFSYAQNNVFFDDCKYHYLIRSNSASRQSLNLNKIYDPIRVKKYILDDSSQDYKEYAKSAYLSTCMNSYNSIICCGNNNYIKEQKDIYNKIKQCAKWKKLLSRKQRLMLTVLLVNPVLYKPLYRIYCKFFQHKVYE